ncbi:MAG: S41 family peptidase [Gemmatimonadetes bacterium]|nr:S41 family peptidase [Gemmatimonadota bacterium]
MKRGRGVLVLALVGVVSFVSGGWLLQRGSTQAGSVYQKARLFEDIVSHVADYYVDSVDERKLYDMAIDGMLEQLNDPYSTFMREKEYRDLTLSTTGNYAGLGIQIGVRDGWVTVIAPLPDTPAEKAGITGGDRIIEVDGQSAYGWKEEKAVQMLRGEAGSLVTVRVARPGVSDSLDFKITRARIHVRSVEFVTLLTPSIGYVQLRTVAESSPEEMKDGINTLRKQGAKALILDLRDNPGGLLESGVKLTDLFLDRDQVVVETKGRSVGSTKSYSADEPQPWPDMPVVVLVDGNTASASEIISGALQDHDRALIVGTATFGKGLVQTLFQLSASEALKITTAKWYTPSGRLIQRVPTGEARAIAMAAAADTAAKRDTVAAKVFKTDGGRVLQGVGGIHPDVVVGSDSLGTAEREFAKSLGSKIPTYRDALTAYAIELKVQKAVPNETFTPTAAMRAELLRRIRAKGVELPDSVWSGVRQFIDQQLAYEAVHYSFSKVAEFKRRAADDVQIQKGIQLLQRARTPRELIALAAAPSSPGANARRP